MTTYAWILTWPLVVLVSIVGWGLIAAWPARVLGGIELRSAQEFVAVGVAVYVALAGYAIAADRYSLRFVIILAAVGLAAAAVETAAMFRRRVAKPGWLFTLACGGALVASVFVLAASRIAHFHWNACDDDVAYLYLAERLAIEGDLLDPFNNRRLTSLGGMSALQALYLVRLPESFLPFADVFLGSVLILVGLWRTAAGKWFGVGVVGALLFVVYVSLPGPGNTSGNTSPVVLPVGLVLATFVFAVRLRAETTTHRSEVVCSAIVGLLVGTAATLRPQFGLLMAVFGVAVVLWPPMGVRAASRLGGLALGAVFVLGGYAAASWRAVGTPMFPVLAGNLDDSWPASVPGAGSASGIAVLGRVFENPAVWSCTAALALGLFVVSAAPGSRGAENSHWSARLYVLLTLLAVAWLALLMSIWWAVGEAADFWRFWVPMVWACLLVPLVLLGSRRVARKRDGRLGLLALMVLAVGLFAGPARPEQTPLVPVQDRYAFQRPEYESVSARIPARAKVLTSVDVPSLLLGEGFEVHTLDLVGSTSPSPHLPYFRGSTQKLSWLREHGYDFVVAVDPDVSACLYDRSRQQANLEAGGLYGAWAPYYLDWFRFLDDAAGMPGVRSSQVGNLQILEL